MARDADHEFHIVGGMGGTVVRMAAAVALARENRNELRDADAAVDDAERELRLARARSCRSST